MTAKKISVLLLILISTAYSGYIFVEPTDLGGGSWQFDYTITALEEPIAGVTIWFDYLNYSDFTITTANAGGWSESLIVPEDWLQQGAGYNIYNWSSPLPAGNTLPQKYSITFTYSGEEAPTLYQDFDIINSNWQPVRTGTTVPEPATIAIFAFGALAQPILKRRRRRDL
jgi:hypothetical protein